MQKGAEPARKRRRLDLGVSLRSFSADLRLGTISLQTWRDFALAIRQNCARADYTTLVGALRGLENGAKMLSVNVDSELDKVRRHVGKVCDENGKDGKIQKEKFLRDGFRLGEKEKSAEVIDVDDLKTEDNNVKNGEIEVSLQKPLRRSTKVERDGKGSNASKRRQADTPLPFYMLQLAGERKYNWNMSLQDMVIDGYELGFISDYMFDLGWMFSECPQLIPASAHQRLIIACGDAPEIHRAFLSGFHARWNVSVFKPRLPLAHGVHHTKMMVLCYGDRGCRIVIHTANMLVQDWKEKAQVAYVRDFPLKTCSESPSSFEKDLRKYLSTLGPEASTVRDAIQLYDFRSAGVALVCSTPGVHKGAEMNQWGHAKLRRLLEKEEIDATLDSPVVCQFSSVGGISENWLAQFKKSVFAGKRKGQIRKRLGITGQLQLVFPTVEQVARSREGWAAGASIPVRREKILRPHVSRLLHQWEAASTDNGRQLAMPHMKCYLRYSAQDSKDILWLLLSSSNLSMAAHGSLQKNDSQLRILSYEAGVLFLPSLYREPIHILSKSEFIEKPLTKQIAPRTFRAVEPETQFLEDANGTVGLPIPFKLPPKPYTKQEIPWHVNPERPFDVPGCAPYVTELF